MSGDIHGLQVSQLSNMLISMINYDNEVYGVWIYRLAPVIFSHVARSIDVYTERIHLIMLNTGILFSSSQQPYIYKEEKSLVDQSNEKQVNIQLTILLAG